MDEQSVGLCICANWTITKNREVQQNRKLIFGSFKIKAKIFVLRPGFKDTFCCALGQTQASERHANLKRCNCGRELDEGAWSKFKETSNVNIQPRSWLKQQINQNFWATLIHWFPYCFGLCYLKHMKMIVRFWIGAHNPDSHPKIRSRKLRSLTRALTVRQISNDSRNLTTFGEILSQFVVNSRHFIKHFVVNFWSQKTKWGCLTNPD